MGHRYLVAGLICFSLLASVLGRADQPRPEAASPRINPSPPANLHVPHNTTNPRMPGTWHGPVNPVGHNPTG